MTTPLKLRLNGRAASSSTDPATPLLYVLRNELDQHGPRFGCGLAQCGACTVHVDGRAVRSCVTPASAAAGRDVTTLDGLAEQWRKRRRITDEQVLHPVQQAFIDEQAAQCGYCINGMVMQAADLLKRTPQPSEQQIREGLAMNLCRCGTHQRIVRAVQRASGQPVTA